MKKIGIVSVMAMLLLAVGVSATSFVVDKDVLVTGDWVWDNLVPASGGHWEDGFYGKWTDKSEWSYPPVTATYNFDAVSPLATQAQYFETETMGEAWKYKLNMDLDANSKGWTQSAFTAVTVNDPATTPSTDFTAYRFMSNSQSKFSASSLLVSGVGFANVGVTTHFDDAFKQMNLLRVNE